MARRRPDHVQALGVSNRGEGTTRIDNGESAAAENQESRANSSPHSEVNYQETTVALFFWCSFSYRKDARKEFCAGKNSPSFSAIIQSPPPARRLDLVPRRFNDIYDHEIRIPIDIPAVSIHYIITSELPTEAASGCGQHGLAGPAAIREGRLELTWNGVRAERVLHPRARMSSQRGAMPISVLQLLEPQRSPWS